MSEYTYKGFKVHYTVSKTQEKPDSYHAKGSVICCIDGKGPSLTEEFNTTGDTKIKAETNIKQMINEYIDFEWDQYQEMHG